MTYDTDKTPQVLELLKEASHKGDYLTVIRLLRHADAGGRLRADSSMARTLRTVIGGRGADAVIQRLAADRCRFCKGGRDGCQECGGAGHAAGKVCLDCAGFGTVRCPFCNGTGLAGYDFVPRGLRLAVMKVRLDGAVRAIGALARSQKGGSTPRELQKRLLETDRCRGVLANAVEQARLHGRAGPRAALVVPLPERIRVEQRSQGANAQAEKAIRALLRSLGEAYAEKTRRTSDDHPRRVLYAHRAKVFARLSRSERFDNSPLRTPISLGR